MAKKSVIARGVKRDKVVARFAEVRAKIKALSTNVNVSSDERQEAMAKLHKMPRNSCASRLTKRCNQCGRPHAVYKKFGLCRLCLRNILMIGQVPGGRKSSW